MKRSTGDKFTRIGMFRISGRSNGTNHETLISSFISLYITDQICEKPVIKAVPHRNVSAEKSEGNQNIKPDDGKNRHNIFHITASKILYECRHWLCLVSVKLWSWTWHITVSQFRKDKILINSRPLDKGLQGNCVYPPGVKALSIFWWLLKAAKVTAFVLGVPHRMIFMCFILDNPSRGGNVMLINQAAIFAEIRETEITRYDCYGVLKVGAFDCSRPNWTKIRSVHTLPDPGTNRP